MKATVKATALRLMANNGITSTLDVKNDIHRQHNNPSFVLTQSEVSKLMRELAKEESWTGSYNGTYIEYSNPGAAPIAAPVTSAFHVPSTQQTVAQGSTNTNSDALSAVYGQKNPGDPYVGYISGNPNFYVTGADKNDVRRKVFLVANSGFNLNIIYDDINFCTADYFFNKFH